VAAPSTVTVVGRVMVDKDTPDADATISFARSVYLRHDDGTVYEPATVIAEAAADGTFSVVLMEGTDPEWAPVGWSYQVTVKPKGTGVPYTFSAIVDGTGEITFGDLIPLSAPAAGQMFIMTSSRSAPGGVAGLDADGDVIDATGTKILSAGAPSWASISGKPSTFPPTAHTHDWLDVTGEPATFPAAAHTHDWADVTGEPATYPPTAHTHDWTSGVTGKPSTFAPSTHASSHAVAGSDPITIAASQVTGLPVSSADYLVSGEALMDRNWPMGGLGMTSGALQVSYFTATKTEAINSIITGTGATAAGSNTLARIGIYSVDANGGLTALLASTANLATLWGSTFATVTRALTSSFSKVAGTRYAVAFLSVGGTAPDLIGLSPNGSMGGRAPRINGIVFSQTDLPASMASGSIFDDYRKYQAILVP
jgi:hypothetical protein